MSQTTERSDVSTVLRKDLGIYKEGTVCCLRFLFHNNTTTLYFYTYISPLQPNSFHPAYVTNAY